MHWTYLVFNVFFFILANPVKNTFFIVDIISADAVGADPNEGDFLVLAESPLYSSIKATGTTVMIIGVSYNLMITASYH